MPENFRGLAGTPRYVRQAPENGCRLVYLDSLPASRLARRISIRAPAIPQPVAIANAGPGSMLLSRHGPAWNTT